MEKTSDKILRWGAITAAFSVLAAPFIVTNSLLFPYVTGKNFLFRIVTEIGFAAWLLLAVRNASARPRKSLLLIALLVFLVVVGIADICGVNPWKSFWSNFERMEGYITLLHLFLYFMVISTLFSEKIWERFWVCSVMASVLMSLYGGFQFLMIRYPVLQRFGLVNQPQLYYRIDATFDNSAYLAAYLIFNIFFAILLCMQKRAVPYRLLAGIAIVVDVLVLYCTATRGAILGFVGGLLLYLVLIDITVQKSWKRKISPYVFVAVCIIMITFVAFRNVAFVKNNPVLSRFSNISWSSDDGRQFIWPIALRAITEHPLLGRGQEGFNDAFSAHYDVHFTIEWIDRAHDVVLDWLVSAGILGVFAYISLFAMACWLLWKRSAISNNEKSLFSGLLGAYFIHNLFTFDTIASYFLFITVLGYIHFEATAQIQPMLGQRKQFRGRDTGPVAIAIAVVLAFSIYVFNWTAFQTCYSLVAAQHAMDAGNLPQTLSAFERALSHSHTLGREEVVDRLLDAAPRMNSPSVTPDTREAFFEMAKKAVEAQVAGDPGYLRYEVVASRFYAAFGKKGEEEKYLKRAAELLTRQQKGR